MNKAVALSYSTGLPAPFVVAKGQAGLAQRLMMIAEENGIQITRMPNLIEELFSLDVGSPIPEHLFEIVADLLAFVYSMRVEV